jgi:glycosyltransferase involved in cell wall biosynthesis
MTRFREPNWLLWAALDALACQRDIRAEVLFLDQTPDAETEKRLTNLETGRVRFRYEPIPARSLSFARNEAIRRADNDVILYIDTDAIAEPDWAKALSRAQLEENAAVVGGRILPEWHKRPLWLARSSLVLDQYSIYELGTARLRVNRVVGASFGIQRALLGDDAYFDEGLGRRDGVLLGGEESDLCARAHRRGLSTVYEGRAMVRHHILPDRISYRWILNRLYYAGVARSLLGGLPNPSTPLKLWDYAVLPVILPFYAAGYIRGKFPGTDAEGRS